MFLDRDLGLADRALTQDALDFYEFVVVVLHLDLLLIYLQRF
jgi:hypothetical protein